MDSLFSVETAAEELPNLAKMERCILKKKNLSTVMIIEGQQLALLVFLPTKLIWAIYRKEKRKEWDKKKRNAS